MDHQKKEREGDGEHKKRDKTIRKTVFKKGGIITLTPVSCTRENVQIYSKSMLNKICSYL